MIIKKLSLTVFVASLVVIARPVQSDVASDLTNYVNSVGGASASTPASIYQGQSRGYINGGRLFVRVPQRSIQPISIKAPKITAGCGGIDIFGGSLSFISASELVNTIKAIGTSAGSYALMLGLRTISSQIANTLGEEFQWLQENLTGNFNSCEAAAKGIAGFGAAMGYNDKDVNLCIINQMETSGADYNEAKKSCGTGGNAKSTNNTPEARKRAFIEGNMVWQILESTQMFATDDAMKQLAMSLTGTIIKKNVKDVAGTETVVSGDNDSSTKVEVIPSIMMKDDALIDAILYGGTATSLKCDDSMVGENGCRQVSEDTSFNIPAGSSLVSRTNTALTSLYNAVIDRTDPATTDVDFVAQTSVPTMRIIRTAALFKNNGLGVQIINDYAEQIAIELLATYVNSVINNISAYANDPKYGNEAEKLQAGIELVRGDINRIRDEADRTFRSSMQIAEQMQYYERIIISAMPQNITRSLAWSAGGGR